MSLKKTLKSAIRRIVGVKPKQQSKFIFQELTYSEYLEDPNRLEEYLCNLYTCDSGIKFFSFRKFFKLPSTFEEYMSNLGRFFPGFDLGKGDVVIDVGAHHGIFTTNMASRGAVVHSFEPNPMSFAILEYNRRSNDFVRPPTLNNCAAGAADLEAVPFDTGVRSTAGSLEKLKDKSLVSGNVIDVKTINLFNYIDEIEEKEIKLMKMDCEGGEYSIFRNFADLKRFRFLIIEAHVTESNQPTDLIKQLTSYGFDTRVVKANHGAVELYCQRK